ncbi:hypothetical protein [Tenacibaculum jejuense]|uniref:Uncharacterized protein n=1 Tax=Tenacibaculum jejuense TaxID=584609 RepID=A0A238UCN2_9FLAO|nr:hypothetical protein [Tenacibaculum jejuense]SNR16224.1 Protein of unknown function precursor [Tenacibaculum jejuense]
MIKKLLIIVVFMLFSVAQAQEKVTEEMLKEQEQLCVDKYDIERIEKDIHSFIDTLSIKEIKKRLKTNFNYIVNNKDTIIKQLQYYRVAEDNRFERDTKHYTLEEERYEKKKNIKSTLVNNNHLHYRDTVQNGAYFEQLFKDNASSLKNKVRNNGATVFKFSSEKTIQPYYSLNQHSEKELKIRNIYYHDGTVNNTPTSIPSHSFPLNSIPIDQMKHVDSIQLEFKIKYVSKIDTIHFNKSDIGVKKGNFKLLKMEKNYVEYETPNDYYPYHKGSILEKVFYTSEGKVLENEYSLSNISLKTLEEDYKGRLNYRKINYEYVKDATTKKQIFRILKYLSLKYINADIKNSKKERVLVKGNVNALTLYLENRRDTITFLATLKNEAPVTKLYTHKLENKTEFIDKNGKIITSIPYPISFYYSSVLDEHSKNIFFTDTKRVKDRTYYFLNKEQQQINEIPYDIIQFLCPSIIVVEEKNKEGYKLLSTQTNKLLSNKTFTRYFVMRFSDKRIYMYDSKNSYVLYDQNDELVTKNSTNVKSIRLVKEDY